MGFMGACSFVKKEMAPPVHKIDVLNFKFLTRKEPIEFWCLHQGLL